MSGKASDAAIARGLVVAPDGAIVVRKSQHPTHPFYLQRVSNAWDSIRYYGVHALIGEEFATREEAEARAAELARP